MSAAGPSRSSAASLVTVKITYFAADGTFANVQADGRDYEAAKTAATALLPNSARPHAYWQVQSGE